MNNVKFREATKADLPDIIQILSNDKLGKLREKFSTPLSPSYYQAFSNIMEDPNQELMVIENDMEGIIATFQMSFIQYLTYQGGIRAQIEAVMVKESERGKGLGELLIKWAINRAMEKGAHLLQLTSDKQRADAIRFYEKIGFRASHEGMKLHLNNLQNSYES